MTVSAQSVDAEAALRAHTQQPCLLVADDQPHILDAIELLVRPEGYRVERARSPQMVLDALHSGSYDALLIDLNYTRDTTSGQEGLDLLARITALDAQLPVIVMTAWANVEVAVEAMRRGARDFIQKPWENARLLAILANQIDLHHAMRRAERRASCLVITSPRWVRTTTRSPRRIGADGDTMIISPSRNTGSMESPLTSSA